MSAELSDSSDSSLNISGGGDPERSMAQDRSRRRMAVYRVVHWSCTLLNLLLSIYLIVLAVKDGVTLFSLHPICMAIAFLVLFPQAVALFDPEYNRTISHKQRTQYHLYLQVAAIICTVVGFVAIYVNKNIHKGGRHFYTYHGICGLVVVIFVCLVGVGGTLAYYSFRLRTYIRPVLLKIAHSFGGILGVVVGNLALILGFYTNWFKRNAGEGLILPAVVLVIVGSLLVLRKSLYTLVDRVKSTFGRNSVQ